jgi:hypothetical protein
MREKITTLEGESSADACRRLGWGPGTLIVGDEGYGPTVIAITAIGERSILAKQLSHNGVIVSNFFDESTWTLSCRDWKEVKA